VNLFVVGWSAERPVDVAAARRALGELLERLPFFPDSRPREWTSPLGRGCAVWIAHPPEKTGGVEYAEVATDRLTLWSGHRAGRFAEVRASDDGREVDQDPMGSYPVYRADDWVSNNPALLRLLAGADEVDPAVAAGLLAGGWSLSGHPVWRGIERIQPDWPDAVPLIGRGLNARAAARELVDVTRALMDWAGRPNVVPVTAGRDSRLVLGAAMKTGLPFTANTGGRPGEADVDVGRQLAQVTGVRHELIPDDPHGSLHEHWRRAAELLELTAGGTASLADAVGFPHGPRAGPLPLWHSGQGGEIARAYYARVRGTTRDELTDSLYAAFAMRAPGRREPLNADGEALVRDQIGGWVAQMLDAGAQPGDVPDLFYLYKRMGTWAGPTHGAVEYVRDTTSPLWHERMLPHLLALPAQDRAAERFHHEVLNELSPELAKAPGWFEPTTALQRRARRMRYLARRALQEARRRSLPVPGGATEVDPFAPVREELREVVAARPGHPAWGVLDRERVESLLGRPDPDEVSRYYLWRLATLFSGGPGTGSGSG
jgi:hypothetical protein